MAVTTTLEKVVCNLKLNNGTTTTGSVKTVNVRLGGLDKNNWDAEKGYAVVDKLAVCLEKPVYKMEEVKTSAVESA